MHFLSPSFWKHTRFTQPNSQWIENKHTYFISKWSKILKCGYSSLILSKEFNFGPLFPRNDGSMRALTRRRMFHFPKNNANNRKWSKNWKTVQSQCKWVIYCFNFAECTWPKAWPNLTTIITQKWVTIFLAPESPPKFALFLEGGIGKFSNWLLFCSHPKIQWKIPFFFPLWKGRIPPTSWMHHWSHYWCNCRIFNFFDSPPSSTYILKSPIFFHLQSFIRLQKIKTCLTSQACESDMTGTEIMNSTKVGEKNSEDARSMYFRGAKNRSDFSKIFSITFVCMISFSWPFYVYSP